MSTCYYYYFKTRHTSVIYVNNTIKHEMCRHSHGYLLWKEELKGKMSFMWADVVGKRVLSTPIQETRSKFQSNGVSHNYKICQLNKLGSHAKICPRKQYFTSAVPIVKSVNPRESFTWMNNFCFLGFATSIWKSCQKSHE